MKNFQKLKVGIIVDDTDQNYLVNDLYKKSLNNKFYSIDFLIIQKKIKNTLVKELINYLKKKITIG